MPTRKPLARGNRFGRLIVIGEPYKIKERQFKVRCRCDCGKEKDILEYSLRMGDTKSCGCLQQEARAKINPALPNGGAAFNVLYRNYKDRAKRKKVCFELSKIDFNYLTKRPCHYCNKIPSQKIKSKYSGGNYVYNGIDRKENNQGYTKENCVPCCKDCNTMKRNMNYADFLAYIWRIYFSLLVGTQGTKNKIQILSEQDTTAGRR